MAVNLFLERVLQYGFEGNYFEEMEIGKIDKSCCKQSVILAIDFDKTKEIVCKDAKQTSYKSCDALKILIDNERIDFIEFKGLNDYLKRDFNPEKDYSKQIQNKVEKFNLFEKIEDSLNVLNLLLRSPKFSLTKNEKKIFREIEKNFIIVTDINSVDNGLEFLLASFEVLSETSSSIKSMVFNIWTEEVEKSDIPSNYNIQRPLTFDCNSFNKFY